MLPAVLRHRGNIFIMAYIIPKHSFLHGNDPAPVLRPPASLIDYIASYKLSMVHKLCSAEHNTAQCRPAGTRMFAAPASSSSPPARAQICLVNCATRCRGLEERWVINWCGEKFETCSFSAGEHVLFSVDSTHVTFIPFRCETHRLGWRWQPPPHIYHRDFVLCLSYFV